ncbi:MAG: RDD family protein [Bacilli bacterium]|nr:RDD family protein [Bacilli bacterium]
MMKYIQIASLEKRLLSSLIDLALLVGLTCLFYFFGFSQAVASVQHFDTRQAEINQACLDSHLYVEQGDKIITYTEAKPDATSDMIEKEAVEPFYTIYLKTVMPEKEGHYYDNYWYGVYVLHLEDKEGYYEDEPIYEEDNRLYEWINSKEGTFKRKSDIDEPRFLEFFRGTFGTATVDLTNTPKVHENMVAISWGKVRATIYASIVGSIIPYLIVPVCLRNGKTVGKLAMGLIVLTDEGYEYAKWKHIIRYLAFYLLEVFGGVVTIGLTLVFSSCLVFFSKKRRAIHDYVAFSCVVNERESVFFKNEEEELAFEKANESVLQKSNA